MFFRSTRYVFIVYKCALCLNSLYHSLYLLQLITICYTIFTNTKGVVQVSRIKNIQPRLERMAQLEQEIEEAKEVINQTLGEEIMQVLELDYGELTSKREVTLLSEKIRDNLPKDFFNNEENDFEKNTNHQVNNSNNHDTNFRNQ